MSGEPDIHWETDRYWRYTRKCRQWSLVPAPNNYWFRFTGVYNWSRRFLPAASQVINLLQVDPTSIFGVRRAGIPLPPLAQWDPLVDIQREQALADRRIEVMFYPHHANVFTAKGF